MIAVTRLPTVASYRGGVRAVLILARSIPVVLVIHSTGVCSMSDVHRRVPIRPGSRVVSGVFIESAVFGLSLEAIGLAVHILAFEDDDIDDALLRSQFPDRNIDPLLVELASVGMVELDARPQADRAPRILPLVEATEFRRAGFIYLVEAGGCHKVGIAQSVTARLRGLQTGSPLRIRLVHHESVPDAAKAEQIAHDLLTKYRLRGEWFDCDEATARRAIATAVDAVMPRGQQK